MKIALWLSSAEQRLSLIQREIDGNFRRENVRVISLVSFHGKYPLFFIRLSPFQNLEIAQHYPTNHLQHMSLNYCTDSFLVFLSLQLPHNKQRDLTLLVHTKIFLISEREAPAQHKYTLNSLQEASPWSHMESRGKKGFAPQIFLSFEPYLFIAHSFG